MIKSYTQFNLLNCKSFHSMLYSRSLCLSCTTTVQHMIFRCVCCVSEDICFGMQVASIIPVDRIEYHSLHYVSSCSWHKLYLSSLHCYHWNPNSNWIIQDNTFCNIEQTIAEKNHSNLSCNVKFLSFTLEMYENYICTFLWIHWFHCG